jgi:predicted Rossmann-fold nucleotide-binding protein
MIVGIIGPTNIDVTSKAAGLDPAVCKRTAVEAGEGLARRGDMVVLVPDRGVALLAAQAYRAAGGSHLIGIIPHGGTSAQAATTCCESHRDLCHETVEDLSWNAEHERICQLADVLVCIGMSCGTIAEIAWTKWVGDTPVIVIRPLVSGIAPEVEAETDVRWVEDLDGVYELLDAAASQARSVGQPADSPV